MKNIKETLHRPAALLAILALLVGSLAPLFLQRLAYAAQIENRYIKMSSASPSATGATYEIGFTTASSTNAVAVDFCAESPLREATCTAPTGFSLSSATLSAQTGTTGWAIVSAATTASHIEIGGATATGGSTAVTLTLDTITNPSTTGSFYARIYTYAAADPDWTSATAAGTDVDFGGVAMTTVTDINITARVQESLSMCTSKTDISGASLDDGVDATASVVTDVDCSFATAPDIEIGHGSPTKILENNIIDVTSAWVQISTNATTGATIRMKATNSCPEGGLTTDPTGADCSHIPGNASTPTLFAANTAAFGLYVTNGALTAGVSTSSGTITADSTYNDGVNDGYNDNFFAMETEANSTDPGVDSTYGSVIASSAAPLSQVNFRLDFGATAGLTTPAGVYTGGESLIATGTF